MAHTATRAVRMIGLRGSLAAGVSSLALLSAGVVQAQNAPLPASPVPGTQSNANTPSKASGNAADGSGNASSSAAPDDTIIVTGIRQSLANSQNIKRNSDTIVDALTAEDIGALPDRSVTEALQRVAGVSITHFAAVNDPDHISPEGQNVEIRGLPYVESQFNGRDAFTANRGRAISFQDIPPELLASIEVFKNQTADQIEGGIAGNINLITRRPLDSTKDIYALSLDVNYPDLAKKAGPEGSALISQQWDTGAGRFGLLGSISYSKIFSQQDSSKITSYQPRCDAGPGCPNGIGTPIAGLTPGTTYYIPTGGGISRQNFDRERQGYAFAAQWESPSQNLLATFQFLRSDTTQTWTEHTFAVVEDTQQGSVVPLAGTSLTFDKNNVLRSGTLTAFNYSPPGSNVPATGIQQQEISRGVSEGAATDDYSFHLNWKATERLKFDFDAQYVDSQSNDLDVGLYGSTWANETINTGGAFPSTVQTAPAGARYTSFADPNSTFWRAAIDHEDNTVGHEYALRADGEFSFEPDSFLKRVRFGARYADRDQRIRSDGYNWGNLSEVWNGNGPVYASQVLPTGFGTYNFGTILRGAQAGGETIYGFLGNNALGYNQFIAGARQIEAQTVAQGGFTGWNPLGQRAGACTTATQNNCIIPTSLGGDGFHFPGEISSNDEKTIAGYARLDFGRQHIESLGGVSIDGNIGVRYVHTNSSSQGNTQFPLATSFGYNIVGGLPDCSKPPSSPPVYNICSNTLAQQQALVAFATGSFLANSVKNSYDDFLPSFNLRVAPTDKLQFRFAYSKAITRPSFNDLYNYTQLSVYSPATTGVNNPIPGFRADARGNPQLKPTKSDNFDVSGEWYFSRVGSLTVTGFYKRLTNVYDVTNGVASLTGTGVPINLNSNNTGTISYTNNGVTQNVIFFGTLNNNNVVNVKGLELSYQQTFSFLPHGLDGLGVTGNYTYIDADNLKGQANNYNVNSSVSRNVGA